MESTTLRDYRQALYACFTRAGDALFEVADALLTTPQPHAFIELSQASGLRRGWPSLYAAFRDGQIDRAALRRRFARHAPAPAPGARLVLGLDTSPIHRPEAATFADRTLVYAPNLPAGVAPTRPDWAFSPLVVLPDPVSSWTYTLDNQRVPSRATATTSGAAQLTAVLPLLPARPLVVADGHYGTAKWVVAAAAQPCDQLLRATRTAVLYRPAPPPTGKRGAPKKDGARFQGSDPTTHGAPDARWAGTDAYGQALSVACWGGRHRKACRATARTAIRIVRAGAADTKRDPREAWCWWRGDALPPLDTSPHLYARRFGIAHGYKFDKQALLWADPRLRTPEQMERWTDVVAAVHNQLLLARPLAAIAHRPWECAARPVTPQQGRRAMPRLIAQVGTPVRVPRPRGKAPGRAGHGGPARTAPAGHPRGARCPPQSPAQGRLTPPRRAHTRPPGAAMPAVPCGNSICRG